jgi:hypothetical protein
MSFRRHRAGLVLVLLTSLLAACDDEAGPGGTGGGGGGEPTAGPCDESGPVEHPTCAEPCPITVDVALRCTDEAFGEHGLSVVAIPDGVVVAIASAEKARIVRVAGDEILADASPFQDASWPLYLATTRQGTVAAVADHTLPTGKPPHGLVFAESVNGAAFSMELIADLGDDAPALAFELGPDGTPFVVHQLGGGINVATRVNGTWTTGRLGIGRTTYDRYTLTASGEPVAFSFDSVENVTDLSVYVGDALPVYLGNLHAPYLRPAQPATADLPPGSPVTAAVAHAGSGVALLWPDENGPTLVSVPGAEGLEGACDELNCEVGTCVVEGRIPTGNAYAIARTDDGAAWIAFVVADLRREVTGSNCDVFYGCECDVEVADPGENGVLHVVRIMPGGAPPETMLELPVGKVVGGTHLIGGEQRAVDARALGKDVAIALRIEDETGRHVRVLRLRGE